MSKYTVSLLFLTLSVISLTAQNVGIGTTAPGFPLNFSNTLGDKISLWGNTGSHYGFGIQSGTLQIHTDVQASSISFGYGSSDNFTERARIMNSGSDAMNINGRINLRNGTSPLNQVYGPGMWLYKADNSAQLAFIGSQNNQNIGFYGGVAGWGFTYDALNSFVGIGNANPSCRLDVTGDVNVSGLLKINNSAGFNGQYLQSTGSTTPPKWVSKPNFYVWKQSGVSALINGLYSAEIPSLNLQNFTIQDQCRVFVSVTGDVGVVLADNVFPTVVIGKVELEIWNIGTNTMLRKIVGTVYFSQPVGITDKVTLHTDDVIDLSPGFYMIKTFHSRVDPAASGNSTVQNTRITMQVFPD